MTVSRWWNERSSPQRIDMYIRWPLYITCITWSATSLLLALTLPNADLTGLAVLSVLVCVQGVACIVLLRAGLRSRLGGSGLDRRVLGVTVVVTAIGVVVGLWAYPNTDVPDLQPMMFFLGALTAALTPVLSWRALCSGVLLGAVITMAYYAFINGGEWSEVWQPGVFYLVVVGIYVVANRVSVWMLVLVWELEKSRAVQARLAVAEERLRFARDFHDVLGRNLTLIAVTSDLAAQLARRGDPQAVQRMLDVRGIAHESAREMREVVSGYRAADLDAELAGARSVLRAAGIAVRVIGDSGSVAGHAQVAFAWVLREATTNVIRHSQARTCTIELGVEPAAGAIGCTAVLCVRNDGARAAEPRPAIGPGIAGQAQAWNDQSGDHQTGHGLAGLGERVSALGGEFTAGAEPGGWFTVRARLPMMATSPAAALDPAP